LLKFFVWLLSCASNLVSAITSSSADYLQINSLWNLNNQFVEVNELCPFIIPFFTALDLNNSCYCDRVSSNKALSKLWREDNTIVIVKILVYVWKSGDWIWCSNCVKQLLVMTARSLINVPRLFIVYFFCVRSKSSGFKING
jgi:hypothetical protein